MPNLKLLISSSTCKDYTIDDIASLLSQQNISSTIIETISTVKYDNIYLSEKGFKIKLYNFQLENFKNLWDELVKLLDLKCGHVKSETYVGCIQNCPDVMVHSNCKE